MSRKMRAAFKTAMALLMTCFLMLSGPMSAQPCALSESIPEEGMVFPTLADNPFADLTHASEPIEIPALPGVYPEQTEGFLPVFHGRVTDEKVVALTIDDCNEAQNLQKIVSAIANAGGQATIFPIGENVSFLAPTLRSSVDAGFEIGNHTLSHSGLYHEDDEGFARQIWQQNYEVSKALGESYHMRFLRPRGGDNRLDQRTHAYMRQMGYCGIAYWTQDGSHSTAKEIISRLSPGEIILFHTTDADVEIILDLIPRLAKKGYRMVTLSQLFDLGENERGGPIPDDNIMPLAPYERFNQALQRNDYLHDVYLMQERLSQLGYLNAEYNGFFGKTTEKALASFQKSAGLDPSGICTPETWNRLFDR